MLYSRRETFDEKHEPRTAFSNFIADA